MPLPQFTKLTPIRSAVSPKSSSSVQTAVVHGDSSVKAVSDSVTGVSLGEQQLAQSIERLNKLLATATHSSSSGQDGSSSDHAAAAIATTAAIPVPFVTPQGRQSAWSKRRVSRVHPGVLRNAYDTSAAADSAAVVFRTHDAHLGLL